MQEEGMVSKSEGLVDLQMTEPERVGLQNFIPKLFVNFRLDEAVPENNFYKILKRNLDLNFIYKETVLLNSKDEVEKITVGNFIKRL